MAKKPTTINLTTSFGSQSVINKNIQDLAKAFENTISRDGSTPNDMLSDLDLGDNDVINVNLISAKEVALDGINLSPLTTAASESAANAAAAALSASQAALSAAEAASDASLLGAWRGTWQTATNYALGDRIQEDGSTYICVVAHTSTNFNTDFNTNNYWELFAAKGDIGPGTGDLLSTNNLSELTNTTTAQNNLGLGSLATKNTVDSSDIDNGSVDFSKLNSSFVITESDDISSNDNDTTIPTSAAVKNYVDTIATSGWFEAVSSGFINGNNTFFSEIPNTWTEFLFKFNNISSDLSGNLTLIIPTFDTISIKTKVLLASSLTSQSGNVVMSTDGTNTFSGFIYLNRVSNRLSGEINIQRNDGVMYISNVSGNASTPVAFRIGIGVPPGGVLSGAQTNLYKN